MSCERSHYGPPKHKHEWRTVRIDAIGKRVRVERCWFCGKRRGVPIVRCEPCGAAGVNRANAPDAERKPCDLCHGYGYVDAPKDRTWLCPCCTGPASERCENCVNRSAAGMHVCTRESPVEVEYEVARMTMAEQGKAKPPSPEVAAKIAELETLW